MKAVQLHEIGPIAGNPLTFGEIPRPELAPGQLLIKVAACGVCRSNLHMIEGDWKENGVPSKLPITPGHEVTGTVAAIANDVEGFEVGRRVGVQPLWWTCEKCEFCQSGREELCGSRKITGEDVDGGYAEYMVANAAHTYVVPDGLDLAEVAPLFCPGITAYGAVSKIEAGPGKRVAVFGVGGVGHMALQFALLTGAEAIAVSRGAAHLEVAKELGATRTIDSSLENAGAVLAAEGGVDAALIFAPSDQVAEQAIAAVKSGGTIVTGVNIGAANFPFATGKVLKASLLGSRKQMNEVLALAAQGKVRALVDRYELAESADVLRNLAGGGVRARAVLVV
jgi:propanol-preferring alcohol dehydrogenase